MTVLNLTDWEAIEAGLIPILKDALALPADYQMFWTGQNRPRRHVPNFVPPLGTQTSIELALELGQSLGQSGTSIGDNPDSVLGDQQEILATAVADVEFTLRLQWFVLAEDHDSPQNPNVPFNNLASLERVLSLETFTDRFDAIGVAMIDAGPVHNLAALVTTQFEHRAAIDVRFRIADAVQETLTYIEKVQATADVQT